MGEYQPEPLPQNLEGPALQEWLFRELMRISIELDKIEEVIDGFTFQPLNSNLTDISAQTTAAYGRAFLNFVSEAAFKAGVNLEAGTDFLSPAGIAAAYPTAASLEGLSLVAGDVLYATAVDTLARLAKGTAAQYLRMNAGATAPEWATLNITPWIAYTPTFTGFGTVASVSIWSRRVGDTLQIRGKFTTGTPTAVEARMTLGFDGTNGNVNSDATKVASIQLAGKLARDNTNASASYILIESNIGYVTFSLQSATNAGLTKILGSSGFGVGSVLSITAEIPISGW